MATFAGITAEVFRIRNDFGVMQADWHMKFQAVEAKIQEVQAVGNAQAVIRVNIDNRMMMQSNQHSILEARVSELIARFDGLERSSAGLSSSAAGSKSWQLTRPKDMGPFEFTGKEEELLKRKESMEDYVNAVHPGMKQALHLAAETSMQVTDRSQLSLTEAEWDLATNLFVPKKKKQQERPAAWSCAWNAIMAMKRGGSWWEDSSHKPASEG